jgi:hypothetical protein
MVEATVEASDTRMEGGQKLRPVQQTSAQTYGLLSFLLLEEMTTCRQDQTLSA